MSRMLCRLCRLLLAPGGAARCPWPPAPGGGPVLPQLVLLQREQQHAGQVHQGAGVEHREGGLGHAGRRPGCSPQRRPGAMITRRWPAPGRVTSRAGPGRRPPGGGAACRAAKPYTQAVHHRNSSSSGSGTAQGLRAGQSTQWSCHSRLAASSASMKGPGAGVAGLPGRRCRSRGRETGVHGGPPRPPCRGSTTPSGSLAGELQKTPPATPASAPALMRRRGPARPNRRGRTART